VPDRSHPQAGRHGRAQPFRRERRRSGAGPRPPHALPGAVRAGPGGVHRAPRPGRPGQRGGPLLRPHPARPGRERPAPELPPPLARVEALVRNWGSHRGVVFDPDGETLVLIDDEGSALSHDQGLLALMTLVAEARPRARVALPVSVSREAERIAETHWATITWTKLSAGHLMEVAGRGDGDFAAS